MNRTFANIFGYTPEEILALETITRLFAPQEHDRLRRYHDARLRGQEAPQQYECQGLRKDGSALWLETMARLVEWDGEPATQATVVDITARKRAEAEREQLQAQLFEAQKMEAIGTLAGGIAHDFNNILGIILGYTELTLMDVTPASVVHTRLMKVLNAGKRARDLVRQILTFSRKTDQQRQPIHLASIIEEALMLLRATLPATIDIRPQIETTAGAVLADPTQMHQVLINLCTNAEHAMRETGGGAGDTLREGGGHGSLAHPSSTIYLPCVDDAPVEGSREEYVVKGHERILFVDDEEALARWGQLTLEPLGYHVVACTSGTEALRILRESPQAFDLLITDQTMPGMTGEVLAREVWRIRPELPIILCTGASLTMTPVKAKRLGIRAYLLKPVLKQDLSRAIRRVLEERSI